MCFSTDVKISKMVTPQLKTIISSDLQPSCVTLTLDITAHPNPHLISEHNKTNNQLTQSEVKEVLWLNPLIEKGVIDTEAHRKLRASVIPGHVCHPSDFIQINFEKATYGDLVDIISLMHRGIIDPEVEKQITKKCHDQMMANFALEYPNPELDRFIELHHGRIENIEDFDIDELENRAHRGLLDDETRDKVYGSISQYYLQLTKDVLEEEILYPDLYEDYDENDPAMNFVEDQILDESTHQRCLTEDNKNSEK